MTMPMPPMNNMNGVTADSRYRPGLDDLNDRGHRPDAIGHVVRTVREGHRRAGEHHLRDEQLLDAGIVKSRSSQSSSLMRFIISLGGDARSNADRDRQDLTLDVAEVNVDVLETLADGDQRDDPADQEGVHRAPLARLGDRIAVLRISLRMLRSAAARRYRQAPAR
jgi:hypothetical protein